MGTRQVCHDVSWLELLPLAAFSSHPIENFINQSGETCARVTSSPASAMGSRMGAGGARSFPFNNKDSTSTHAAVIALCCRA